jgi:hypothetical protein
LIGFAILALKDDAPQWTFADDVSDSVGREASCEKIGVMVITAEREDIYACEGAGGGAKLGCFARVEGDLVDVTRQAQALGTLQNRC